jgi:RNA polymerase sigma-B factor
MGEVRRYFRDSGWAVRVPRRLKEIHAQAISVTHELSHHLGRAPTASELATELGVDRQEMVEALTAGNCYSATSMTLSDRPAARGTDSPSTTRWACWTDTSPTSWTERLCGR